MPKVPVLSPEIRPKATPMVSPAPVLRPPEAAFGGDIVAAQEKQGEALQDAGDVVWKRMYEHQERENAQQNMDLQTQLQKDIQNSLLNTERDENNMPKGYLNRSLNQAKGATIQFDQDAAKLRQTYMAMVKSPIQRQQMNQIISTHLTAARESVVAHEAQQTQAAFDKSFEANMKQTVGNAATITDPGMLAKYIDTAQAAATPGWQHAGLGGIDVEQAKQGYASEITKSALVPLLEADPKAAEKLVDGVKDRLSPEAYAEMHQQVIGKQIYDIVQDVGNKAKSTFRMADGMIDRARVDAYVDSMKLQPQIAYQVKRDVDRMAMVDYSEIMKRRQDSERNFTNELVAAQAKGVPYDQALKLAPKYGWDNTAIANMENEVTKIYANPADRWSSWLSKQPQATQGAWQYVEQLVKSKYPTGTKGEVAGVKGVDMYKSAITELQQDLIGKTPDQMRDIAKQKLEKVVVGPGAIWGMIWPNKAEGWRADADTRQGFSEAFTKLGADPAYGFERVQQAKARLAQDGVPVTPQNVKTLLDSALSRRGK
jgi:hypothetical protein